MTLSTLTLICTLTWMVNVASLSQSLRRFPDDICSCKNWKSEYKHERASCGKGKEYYPPEDNAPAMYRTDSEKTQNDLCTQMFHRLDSKHCVNVNAGKDNGTWCYTDPNCNELNGGKRVPGQLSWKNCKRDQSGRPADPRLRDFKPEELEDYAKQQDIELGGLVRLSYPGSRADKGKLANLADFNDTMPEEIVSTLKEVGNGDEPVWFDTNKNADVPIVIVQGHKAWKVDKTTSQDPMHPGKWSKLTCIAGCRGLYLD